MPYPKNDAEFNPEFSNEEKCLEYIEKLKYKDGIYCQKCKTKLLKVRMRTYECTKCHRQESVLSGTLFQDTHKPLVLWFKAIWYIASSIGRDTAYQLQRSLGIKSYKTAWVWLQKLRQIMVNLDKERLSGDIEVIGDAVKIRGKGEKNRTEKDTEIPILIAMKVRNNSIKQIRIGVLTDISKDSQESFIQEAVEKKSNITTYKRQNKEERHFNIISQINKFVRERSLGFYSKKHLPYYFDVFTFHYNYHKEDTKNELFSRLIKNAVQQKPVTYRNIVANN